MSSEAGWLTAFEHSSLPVESRATGTALSPDEARVVESIDILRPGFAQRRHRSIRFGHYCGVVNLSGRILEVVPKIERNSRVGEGRDVLLRMARVSGVAPFEHLPVGQTRRDAPLLEPFIAAFLEAAAAIVRSGLLHRYEVHESSLSVVRGRLDLSRQAYENWSRPDRIACRYDELSADHQLNRLVKRGLRVVRPWLRSPRLERRWIEVLTAFDDITDERLGEAAIDQIVWDRKAAPYRQVIEWVRVVLRLHTPALRAGSGHAPALLFDMNRLFESVVATVLADHLEPSGATVRRSGFSRPLARTAGSTLLNMRPDFVITQPSGIVAIADAKWKKVTATGHRCLQPSREDLYQMYAYAQRYGCDRLVLVYPWRPELQSAGETTLYLERATGVPAHLEVVCIDVGADTFPIVTGDVVNGTIPPSRNRVC